MSEFHSLNSGYTIFPTLARQRWMNEAIPIGNQPHYSDYQVDGHVRELGTINEYSHYHHEGRGRCAHHIDCPHGTLCIRGECAEKCRYDSDCPLGTTCRQGRCRVETCKHSDSECSSGICNRQLHQKDRPHYCLMRSCHSDRDCFTGRCLKTAHGSFCGRRNRTVLSEQMTPLYGETPLTPTPLHPSYTSWEDWLLRRR